MSALVGPEDEAIRARFRVPPTRYFQLLVHTHDTAGAVEARPMVVHRLRRLRDAGDRELCRRAG
ncbi:DUF3263 domain-containing protein [Microbacterium sp. NPDC086615]|uniref:DUF3263 domain-containing protein n=1 Tax=Microbacterium sp. NPDC086615 TaxID=3154865 RepID=UPI003436FD99